MAVQYIKQTVHSSAHLLRKHPLPGTVRRQALTVCCQAHHHVERAEPMALEERAGAWAAALLGRGHTRDRRGGAVACCHAASIRTAVASATGSALGSSLRASTTSSRKTGDDIRSAKKLASRGCPARCRPARDDRGFLVPKKVQIISGPALYI